ncbi:branched-chain amino acid ABC transporter permease [Nakamurella lactea]|uniref:branched-chain amino acid ABC transporter permease n=1 Tax=Nakamurella lactea TaxID=459515 RepID=UPI000425D481|nr:branched-chain amino acid ABC transporter permease [Nakamurella lactea]
MPLQLWISVVELSCFAGLIALGFFLVLRGADLFMFALGPLAMFGAMFGAYMVSRNGWPVALAVVVGVVIASGLSVASELLVVRPIHRRTGGEENPSIVAIVAVLFLLEQLAGTLFGRRPLPGSALWRDSFTVGGAVISGQAILLVAVCLLAFGGVAWWLRGSATGRMLRAVGDNERAAAILGIPVAKVRMVAFAMAGALAGIAGALFATKGGVTFTSGLQWTLVGFLAVIVGGLGSVWAPLVGAVIVALLQTWTVYKFGQAMEDYVTFAVAFLFFALRPKGIFQTKVRI